jgi:bifunctional UDP-N-acetylglucosamine pyrophosphorylase / glucosamine-1-phosphate N-acetyltransferase
MTEEANLGAIVLAAGQGKRMQSTTVNKVTLPLAGKPMILYTADLLEKLRVSSIVVVVGFAKESVEFLLKDRALFAEQKERLGTAHAVRVALEKMPADISDVLILQGDDSAFYKKELIESLIEKHFRSGSSFTFLTIEVDNPFGLGRILRDKYGKLKGIVEEKDAKDVQREIHEINPACYIANIKFLERYLPKVEKSPATGEYYLTSLIDIGIKNNEIVETLKAGKILWRGVNTPSELQEAEDLIIK